jgi:hypothetical protein
MIRLAWLQSRTQTLIAAALLAALAVAAAVTGVELSHLYNTLVAHCRSNCDLATTQFLSHDRFMDHTLAILAQVVPALFGLFWGAPLIAREFEAGTYRLAWTQSVSRSRWLSTKLALGALATAAGAGATTLAITWWYRAYDKVGTNQYAVFDRRDIAPIGYAVFGFALGAVLGAVLRRTVPAMAATLAGYVFARIATTLWVRPHLLTPVRQNLSLRGAGPTQQAHLGIGSQDGGAITLFVKGNGPANSWTLSSQVLDRSGHPPGSAAIAAFVHKYCGHVGVDGPPAGGKPVPQRQSGPAARAAQACLNHAMDTFHVQVRYVPADRYWTLQWFETGVYVALAVAAVLACYWWVIRRSH